jgi:integrase
MIASHKSKATNLLVSRHGTARFYEKPKARSGWAVPTVPECQPNWLVRFHVGGQSWEVSAGPMYPVRDGLVAVKVWAETVMRTKLEAMRCGKVEQMEAVVRPARLVLLSELLAVYLGNVPPNKPDYSKNAARLRMICEEITGLSADEIALTEKLLSAVQLRNWVRMRQEHFRRGWSVRGAAPEDAWAVLRAELKAGRLAGIDKTEVMECNTTVHSYLRCAKAVFANNNEYLPGLVLPDLREFLGDGSKRNPGFTVKITAPKGHREIEPEVLAAITEDLARLRVESPRLWAFNQLVAWTASRPITVRRLDRSALTVNADGSGLVTLPTTKRGNPVTWPVSAEVVAGVLEVTTDESLIGANGEMTYRAHNEWLTSMGMEGTKKSSIFRHIRLQQVREHGGVEMAAAAGGHTTTDMVERTYTKARAAMPFLDPLAARAG